MTQAVAPERAAVPTGHRMLPALLVVLTIFGPISMDLYLPVLPALTTELKAVTSAAQLTMTACLIGLGAGQLIAGALGGGPGQQVHHPVELVGVTAQALPVDGHTPLRSTRSDHGAVIGVSAPSVRTRPRPAPRTPRRGSGRPGVAGCTGRSRP